MNADVKNGTKKNNQISHLGTSNSTPCHSSNGVPRIIIKQVGKNMTFSKLPQTNFYPITK